MNETTSPADDYAATLGLSVSDIHDKLIKAQEGEPVSFSIEEMRFLKACVEIACGF